MVTLADFFHYHLQSYSCHHWRRRQQHIEPIGTKDSKQGKSIKNRSDWPESEEDKRADRGLRVSTQATTPVKRGFDKCLEKLAKDSKYSRIFFKFNDPSSQALSKPCSLT
jgi:hypothetical protein